MAVMCGRATLSTSPEELKELFELEQAPELIPRYNIAPSQSVAVIREPHRLELLRWGLLPARAKRHGGINVRIETVARVPDYRSSFRSRRCLVIVDGFYEWQREGKLKKPFLVQRPDKRPFALAGIWDRSTTVDGEVIDSCAVITRDAEGDIAKLHDRMPLILAPEDYAPWLDSRTENAVKLLRPAGMALVLYAVNPIVNSPANDDARCIEPVDPTSVVGETRSLFPHPA
jgi:putative SOS response-associated peptidase YedK